MSAIKQNMVKFAQKQRAKNSQEILLQVKVIGNHCHNLKVKCDHL